MDYQPYTEPVPNLPGDPYGAYPPPKKRMSTGLIVLVVALLLLCCCCAFGALFYFVLGDAITDAIGLTMLLLA